MIFPGQRPDAADRRCCNVFAVAFVLAVMTNRMGSMPLRETEQTDSGTDGLEPAVNAGDGASASPLSALQFHVAVLRHHRLVYRVAHSLVRNGQDAEDVTQETFLRYWQHGANVLRPREWLLSVARNACLDRLRAAGRWIDTGADAALELPDERDPAWHYQQSELSATLGELIEALPEPQRSLIVLFDVHGVKGDACARILGISQNQVRVYLHRARRRLRLKLERNQ